jgi:lipopolysaccharide biosynthesis glycosyltransferase
MDRIFQSTFAKIESVVFNDNTLQISISSSRKLVLFYFDTLKHLHIKINTEQYDLDLSGQYHIFYNNHKVKKTVFDIEISRMNNNILTSENLEQVLRSIKVYEFGNPIIVSNKKYQIMYSFDKNYYSGASASIVSLVKTFRQDNLDQLYLNICIEKDDIPSFIRLIKRLKKEIVFEYSIYVLNKRVLDDSILLTTCFKGGNHLLKLANFNRLICGHIINCKHLLYLDSDTIVQTDLSSLLDSIPNDDYIIMGKMSTLTVSNILNVKNIEYAKNYIGENIKKPIIYTGTLIINPAKFRRHYSKMIELIKTHNSLENKGGLYKLFTMSIINISLLEHIKYFDGIINNVVDLGCKKDIDIQIIEKADVLDWSGLYKPWYDNGMYRKYWKKYDMLCKTYDTVQTNKNTVESFTPSKSAVTIH